MVFNINSLWS